MTASESFIVRNRTAGHFQRSFRIDAAAISGRSVSAYCPAFDCAVAASVNVDTATLDGKAAGYGSRAGAVSYGKISAVFNGYDASVVTRGIRIPSVSVKLVPVKIDDPVASYLEAAFISVVSAFGYILFKTYHLAFSIPEYSFHWHGESGRLYLFEAPIDMLSFITLHPENWQSQSYAAACSVSDRVLMQMLKDDPSLQKVFLCLDNDKAGHDAAARMMEKLSTMGIQSGILVPTHKDWNEDLLFSGEEEAMCQDLQL